MKRKWWIILALGLLIVAFWCESAGADGKMVVPGSTPIDEEHFPDAEFRNLVRTCFDENGNGWLSEAEISAVTVIDFEENTNLFSVRGIEYFTELKSLVLTGMPGLKSIDLQSNQKLTRLELTGNALTSLDVSGLPLESLLCSGNALTGLTLGSQPSLKELLCYGNPGIVSLDLCNAPILLDAVLNGTLSEPDWGNLYEGPLGGRLFADASTILIVPGGDSGDPEPTFFLPANLTAIEDEAFSGISAEAVVIPGTVTSIAGNPFAGSSVTTIYGIPGSAAQAFAEAYGYAFVPVRND